MFYDGQLLCPIKATGLPKRQSLFGKEEAPADRVKQFLAGIASKTAVGKDKVGGCRQMEIYIKENRVRAV